MFPHNPVKESPAGLTTPRQPDAANNQSNEVSNGVSPLPKSTMGDRIDG